jgi:hypothetical protein
MGYDPGAQAIGEIIGDMFSGVRAAREARQVEDVIQAWRNRTAQMAVEAGEALCLLGALEEALREIDPHHPIFRHGEWNRIRELGRSKTRIDGSIDWIPAPRRAGQEARIAARAPNAPPGPREEIQSLRAQLAAVKNELRLVQDAADTRLKKEESRRIGQRERLEKDLVDHRAQRAIYRHELQRSVPDHPLSGARAAGLLDVVSRAAQTAFKDLDDALENSDGTINKEWYERWKRADEAALSSLSAEVRMESYRAARNAGVDDAPFRQRRIPWPGYKPAQLGWSGMDIEDPKEREAALKEWREAVDSLQENTANRPAPASGNVP